MPFNHLVLCHPLLHPPIFPSIRVFSNESAFPTRWPNYWSFSFNISPTNEHPGLISFKMDWLDLLAVQGTLKSLLQHHSSKASILWCSVIHTRLLEMAFVIICHSFSSKEQVSFNFMAKVTICSDFGAPKMKSVTDSTVSLSMCHEVMVPDAMMFIF